MTELTDTLRRLAIARDKDRQHLTASVMRKAADELEAQAAESLEVDHANRDLAARLAAVQPIIDAAVEWQKAYDHYKDRKCGELGLKLVHEVRQWRRAALEADQQPAPPTTEPQPDRAAELCAALANLVDAGPFPTNDDLDAAQGVLAKIQCGVCVGRGTVFDSRPWRNGSRPCPGCFGSGWVNPTRAPAPPTTEPDTHLRARLGPDTPDEPSPPLGPVVGIEPCPADDPFDPSMWLPTDDDYRPPAPAPPTSEPCSDCKGSGTVRVRQPVRGHLVRTDVTCPSCGGSGRVSAEGEKS